MDRNFLLAMALSMAVVVTWTMYTEGQRQEYLAENPPEQVAEPDDSGFETSPAPEAGSPAPSPATSATRRPPVVPTTPASPAQPEVLTTIRTDFFDAELTSRGGALRRWNLIEFDDPSQAGRPPVDIVTLRGGEVALATPLEGLGFGDLSDADYRLQKPDSLTRVFVLEKQGVTVRKTYFFNEEGYHARLRIEVENGSDRHLQPNFAVRWPARLRDSADFSDYSVAVYHDADVALFPIATSRSFMGFGGGGIEQRQAFAGGVDWLGADTTYFLAAIAPEVPERAEAWLDPDGTDSAMTELRMSAVSLPPGQRLDSEYRIYLGPKEQARLDSFGAHLDEAIQKGWFPSLTRFFAWLLSAAYQIVPNYGVAIILITIMVRLLMAPLMARQMKSMKRMSDIAPKMKEIQEKYKDDRERQSQEMMALYKREGVSPFSMLSGCFPMLLQFPVFIGFYFALQSAIQLRQQPFVLWIDDLSRPESLFVIPGIDLPVRVLPILMGASMFLQQKLTPSGSMDPAQQRMMMTVMPVMFTVLFYQFASGLVLYWFFSTLIGIGQQIYTNRNTKAPATATAS